MIQALDQLTNKKSSTETINPATSERPVVNVRGLTKVFSDFWGRPKAKAVDNISFEVYKGEVFGLLGPNGSGKTTTIKIILGLLNPTRGMVEVLGHSPKHVATKARIGYLPEESYLYRYLTPEETLDFFGSLFGIEARERKRRIVQLLDMVGLGGVRRRTVGEFSKGMQRRIGLAQALINDPDLIILDEPTSGLDPIGCREMKDLIMMLAKRGKTIILCSHLLADVEELCSRIAILYGGKIQAMGTLNELLSERDRIRITCPVLKKETLDYVLKIIRDEVGEGKIKIDNPRQNLESYFLSVIERARETVETSGATQATKIAEYLLEGMAEKIPAGADKVLERLVLKHEPQIQSSLGSEPAKVVNEEKLHQLTLQPQTDKEQSLPPEQPAHYHKKIEEANEKLSRLLSRDS